MGYNRTYTKEKWELVPNENKEMLKDYLLEIRARKLSPRTILGYEQDLKIIITHINDVYQGKLLTDLTRKAWRDILLWMSEGVSGTDSDSKGRSAARCNRMKSACNQLMEYISEADEYDYVVNQSSRVKGLPKNPVWTDEDKFYFTYDEFKQVRQILLDEEKYQWCAYWCLSFDSGSRLNEICQINKSCMNDDTNLTNVVVGKRSKQFRILYMPDTKEVVNKWLEVRGRDNVDSLWVVEDSDGNRRAATREDLYSWMKKISKVLSVVRGKEADIHPHSARHSRAQSLLDGTDDRLKNEDGTNRKYTLDEIRVLLHHSSTETTKGYVRDEDEKIFENLFC